MKTIQLIELTEEEFLKKIDQAVSPKFERLEKQFQPKEPEEFLTRLEVAKLLKVDISTVFNWRKRGILKPYGVGGRIFYKRSEIEQSIQEL